MTLSTPNTPGLVSLPRITTLLASLLVAIGAGTNYVYSAYSPQLGSRLHITHTQLNIIGLAGNVGVYGSGPICGRLIDARGPSFLFPSAFVCLLVGYSGIRYMFDHGTPGSVAIVYALVVFSFMTGVGGNAGLANAVNATAKSFPDGARATVTGTVISGFGLSAFFFSVIAHAAFAENISSFLLLLSLGTSFPMVLGFFLVRIIPLPTSENTRDLEYRSQERDTAAEVSPVAITFLHEHDSQTPLLANDHLERELAVSGQLEENPSDYHDPQIRGSLEMSPARNNSTNVDGRRHHIRGQNLGGVAALLDHSPNIHGKALLKSGRFWLLCMVFSLLSGTGLMYINNVGSMSLALSAKGDASYDRVAAARWQAAQVSSLSIMNFSGRIVFGLISDSTKHYLSFPRSYCLSLISILFIISQILTASVSKVEHLWMASALLGLSYGGMFGTFPTMIIDWFGLAHFSENWGYTSLAPLIFANIFSVAFGMNLDAHAPPKSTVALPLPGDAEQCLQGRECYVDSLYLTTAACSLALLLSIWMGWRDRKKLAASALKEARSTEVVWEGGAD